MEKARSVLDYFEPYLGRIEIVGGAGRIERVYFEIKQSHIDQWEKPQIKVNSKITSSWVEEVLLNEVASWVARAAAPIGVSWVWIHSKVLYLLEERI